MKIRDATLQDVNEIVKLGGSVKQFQTSKEVVTFWPKAILVDCIKNKNNPILVAEDNKQIVGFIISNYTPDFKKAVIENIFVKSGYRRNGVGTTLLNSLLKKLVDLKCEYVCLLCDGENDTAINFYIKNRFNKGMTCVWLDSILDKSFKK
jgi:ribosomal protein S18 acetylase RimI-like enzyme